MFGRREHQTVFALAKTERKGFKEVSFFLKKKGLKKPDKGPCGWVGEPLADFGMSALDAVTHAPLPHTSRRLLDGGGRTTEEAITRVDLRRQ